MAIPALDIFENHRPEQSRRLAEVEHRMLGIADRAYTSTSLKPMSKVLFFVSRVLVALGRDPAARSKDTLIRAYELQRRAMGARAPLDDFDFSGILTDAGEHLSEIVEGLAVVQLEAREIDALGLAFDTLLRGRWESGEGLGTFLTPEEIVSPIVDMMLQCWKEEPGPKDALLGDICGGTGRFARALVSRLSTEPQISTRVRLLDQSSMSIGLSQLNFFFDGYQIDARIVRDSLTDEALSLEAGRFGLLATNPPFGNAKYRAGKDLWKHLPRAALGALGLLQSGDTCDPASVFLLRNLSLLGPGGVLGIVLPDGVIQSPSLLAALKVLESAHDVRYDLRAFVSLPAQSFSLGGTVAKTSFTVWKRRSEYCPDSMFVAVASHVGFLKRGNRRVADPNGNELPEIVRRFAYADRTEDWSTMDWRHVDRLTCGALRSVPQPKVSGERRHQRLGDLVDFTRESMRVLPAHDHAHISILAVDGLGTIDIAAALIDAPITPGLRCEAGDLLVSCLNPRKWRVAMVPDLEGLKWSCSSEFAVLRPKDRDSAFDLFLRLMHSSVSEDAGRHAVGTSSSRQRVPKRELLKLELPPINLSRSEIESIQAQRLTWYRARIKEVRLFSQLFEKAGEANS
jgi:hypothetical protein